MKAFTQVGQKRFNQVKPENINDNTRAVIDQYNGRMDAQNMPTSLIDQDKFVAPTATDSVISGSRKTDWQGQTQSYYRVRRFNTTEGGLNYYEPDNVIDLNATDWSSGWNNLTSVNTDYRNFYLEFTSQEGSLNGCMDINFRRGTDIVTPGSGGNTEVGQDHWIQWGLFVNDLLVCDTGRVYPRLENLSVPFKILCGTQQIRIEIKFKTIFTQAAKKITSGDTQKNNLEIYGSHIWVCNTRK
jgi:hypothetical protein